MTTQIPKSLTKRDAALLRNKKRRSQQRMKQEQFRTKKVVWDDE